MWQKILDDSWLGKLYHEDDVEKLAAAARLIAATPKLQAALDGLVRLLNGPADFTTEQIEALQEAGVYE